MRAEFERLLRDATLTTVALAIALGWSLYQFCAGVSSLVTTFFTTSPHGQVNALLLDLQYSQGLTWQVGGRVLTFGKLVGGLIELALVLGVALVVRRRPAHVPPAS